MASIAIIDVYEAVLRGKEKSYYEALKEFLEIFVDLILNRKRKVSFRLGCGKHAYKICGVFKKVLKQEEPLVTASELMIKKKDSAI